MKCSCLLALLLAIPCGVHAQPRPVAQDLSFDAKAVASEADKVLRGYFASAFYSKRGYDKDNPIIVAFDGRDCSNKPQKYVVVAYKPSDPAQHLLAAVFRVQPDGSYELEGEGPGMGKDVAGVMKTFVEGCHHK